MEQIILKNGFLKKTNATLSTTELEILTLMLTNPDKDYKNIVDNFFSKEKLKWLKNNLFKLIKILDQGNALPKINNFTDLCKLKSFGLTEREIEIATLIIQGYKYKAIAEKLFINEKTVSKHASNMYKKTNAQKRKVFENIFKC